MVDPQKQDGEEDVADFLARIRDTPKREDEDRSRKLEEEILQGRKEREARRAGRSSHYPVESILADSRERKS